MRIRTPQYALSASGPSGDGLSAPTVARGASVGIPSRGYPRSAPWLVIAMMVVVAVRLHEVFPLVGKLRPALVLGLGGTAVLLWRSHSSVLKSAIREPILRQVALYFCWACFTIPFAIWKGGAFTAARVFAPAAFLVLAMLLCAPSRRNLERFVAGFLGSATLMAFMLLFRGERGYEGRLSISDMFDSNDVAALLSMAFPFAVGLLFDRRFAHRIFGILAAALIAVAVIATGSRGGTIGLAIGAIVFVLGLRKSRRIVMLAAMLVAGILVWGTASAEFRYRMLSVFSSEQRQLDYNVADYMGRWQVWQRAIQTTARNPILGVGIGNAPVAEGQALTDVYRTGKWSTTHNAYLQASVELGIPGAILFLSLFFVGGRLAYKWWRGRAIDRRNRWHRPEFMASLVGFAVSAFFLSHAYFYALFALLALIAFADRVLRLESAQAAIVPVPGSPGARSQRSQPPGFRSRRLPARPA